MSGPADPRRLVDAVEAADRALVDEDLITENDAEVKALDPVELLRGPADDDTPRGGRQRPLPKLADPTAPLLVVENLKTYFDLGSGQVRAVDGVSFTLRDGEALGHRRRVWLRQDDDGAVPGPPAAVEWPDRRRQRQAVRHRSRDQVRERPASLSLA